MDYFLTTYRLGFRCWTEDDFQLALELWSDPEVMRLVGGPLGPEGVRMRLANEITQMEALGIQYWPIFLLKTGEHVGSVGLRPRVQDDRVFELGFHLRRAFWGKGYATEAAREVVEYAFETLAADALFAGHHPMNDRSRKVLEQLRFKSTSREHYPPIGMMEPTYLLRRK